MIEDFLMSEQIPHEREGRRCRFPGCRKPLSIYNHSRLCFNCQEKIEAVESHLGSNRQRRRAVRAFLMCMGGGKFKTLPGIARRFKTTVPEIKRLRDRGAEIIRGIRL